MEETDTTDPSAINTPMFKRWKPGERAGYLFIGFDVFSGIIGISVWLLTGNLMQGLIWGGGTWAVSSYVILPLLVQPLMVGLTWGDLHLIVTNFCKHARNDHRIYIVDLNSRRLSLYCEITQDQSEYIGVILPRKYWQDLFDEGMSQELSETAECEIIEAKKNFYVAGPRDADNILRILQYLMEKTDVSVERLAIESMTNYVNHVFSDKPPPPENIFNYYGMQKK